MTNHEPIANESELVWRSLGSPTSGFFVDIGANEPKRGSQSWLLEQNGWRGILVEPQAALAERLERERPRSRVFRVACGPPGHPEYLTFHVATLPSKSSLAKGKIEPATSYAGTEQVPVKTVTELLEECAVDSVDFVSIDVEGTQEDVVRGFDLKRWRPALLLVEDHLHSLSTHRLLKSAGYRLVKRTGLNNWYVPRERPLAVSTALERLRLWKKVWLNTPFRKLRLWNERRRFVGSQP